MARPVVRLLRAVNTLLLLVLIAVSLAAAIGALILPASGRHLYVIQSGSMSPALPVGSLILVEPAAAERLAVGDVVTIRIPDRGTVYTHRVSRLVELPAGLHLETRGDANAAADPALVAADRVVGRVTWSAPGLGRVVMALQTGPARLGLVSLVVLLLLVDLFWTDLFDRPARSRPEDGPEDEPPA